MKKIGLLLSVVLLMAFAALSAREGLAQTIPKDTWTLVYCDSQELIGEDGAATNAFDGNPATIWHSEWFRANPPCPHEIQIDLGYTYYVDGFRYLPRQDGGVNGRIGQYEFYVSMSSSDWGAPVATGTFANTAAEKEVTFPAKLGRFVRLRALTEVNSRPWTSAAEIGVLGTLYFVNQPPNGEIVRPAENVVVSLGEPVTFAGSGSDPDGDTGLEYLWSFGAGSGIADSTLQNPGEIRFLAPGTFTVTLTVTDSLGLSDPTPATRTVTVLDEPFDLKPDWSGMHLSPFTPTDPGGESNPVLTAEDITDATAAYVADPFLFYENGIWYMFFEIYEAGVYHGHIGLATSQDGRHWTYDRIVLTENWHLSYPFVFKHNGRYYLVPESSEIGEVRLYEATAFPYEWQYVSTLVSGRAFVDPSIVRYRNSWWMFVGDTGHSCYLFSSSDLATGWTEHPMSPIVASDPGKGRPGGRSFIFDGGRLFRVAQQEELVYGERVRVFEVDTLNGSQYAEHEIAESPILGPSGTGWNALGMHQFDPWWDGAHWISAVDGWDGHSWSIGIFTSTSRPESLIVLPAGNITIQVGESVEFAGSGSDPDGDLPLSYLWQFGAGSGIPDSTLQNPGWVQFNTPGTYTVTLTVTDASGLSDLTPASRTVTVRGNSAPIPKQGWSLVYCDSQELIGENGAATNAFDGASGTIWHTEWFRSSPPCPHEIQIDLGATYSIDAFRYLPRQDGSANGRIGQYEFYVGASTTNWGPPVATGTFANSAAEKEVAFPAKEGRFVRLRALTEVNGRPWTSAAEINVVGSGGSLNQPPNGTILTPSGNVTIDAGDWVEFAGNGTDPDGNYPLTYLWQFGAGSGIPNSTQQNPGSVQFNVPGTYTVTFTVTDALGLSDPTPATRTIAVRGGSGIIPQQGWSLVYVDSQELVGENGAATNAFDGAPGTIWHTEWFRSNPPCPHEIQIDLGFNYNINGFRYLPRQDGSTNGRIGQYEFYVSTSPTNWGSPVASGTFANSATEKEVLFAPKAGRFVRLRALTEVAGRPWTSMGEINVMGSP